MTKKDFKRIAAALAESRPTTPKIDDEGQWQWEQWTKDCDTIANVCYKYNPNFEFKCFYAACDEEVI